MAIQSDAEKATKAVEEYNYSTFTTSEARGKTRVFAEILHAGDEAPDFELVTPEGETVHLSDFRGQKHVLLEFGSITWPPFVGEVSPLNKLYADYRDKGFEFLTVYVREPHPGENYTEHHSWDQKLQYAKDAREQDNIETPVLVDDLAGTMHSAYGEMPNMVYVINKDGRIFYRSMWTDHAEIESVLQDMVRIDEAAEKGQRLRTSYTERLVVTVGYGQTVSEKVLGRAGPKAAEDMKAAFQGHR